MRHVRPVHMQHMNVVPCKDVVDYLHYAVDRIYKFLHEYYGQFTKVVLSLNVATSLQVSV